jgi:hypothetical protein
LLLDGKTPFADKTNANLISAMTKLDSETHVPPFVVEEWARATASRADTAGDALEDLRRIAFDCCVAKETDRPSFRQVADRLASLIKQGHASQELVEPEPVVVEPRMVANYARVSRSGDADVTAGYTHTTLSVGTA